MSGLEAEVVRVGQFALSAIIVKLKTYVNHVKNCEQNLALLLDNLESLRVEKDDIDEKVLSGKEKLEKVTAKAARWLAKVREFTRDELMRKLMFKDMEITKVMLKLINDDLKKFIEEDVGMRDLVVKVMKNIAKHKRKAGNNAENKKDDEVGRVLEKLVVETMEEFKALMQNDMDMAIAALHLLENHTDNLERLVEKDKKVAEIIAKAREMSVEEELLSDDNHDNVLVNENTLRQKVTNLLRPVGEVVLNDELLNSLPENVRLGMEAMGAVIGNRRGLKAELKDSDNAARHRNCWGRCVISCYYISDRHDMSVAAEAMLVVIKDIIGNKPLDVTRPIRRGEMEVIPTNNCVGLGSRNELLQKIIKALASSEVHALGVFGMGGTGKTTLGREVAMKAIGMFETTVMVEISVTPNIEYIQNQIGDGLGLALHNVHGVHEKAIRLYTKLKPEEGSQGSKKILIILDNIWNKIDPVQMGIPREYCKLLLTSRERGVCKAMDVPDGNIFEVGLLNEVEAKDLFKFQVQKEVTGEYNSVADRLLEKCGGLPLSIVATANSLKGKELPLWRQFAEELEKPITCQITGARYETFSILRTSYEVMASEEKKKFFLLACLSPVGSSISIDNLMRYGIGLDLFQHVNKLSEAIELARTWAKELVSSSMLLKGDSNEYVKIHDVVRESTMSFASKTAMNTDGQMFLVDAIPRWICEETFNKYIGISLLAQPNFGRLSGVNAELLQILLFKGNGIRNSFLESNFFQGMTNLKVLEMSFMNFEKGLPESLCKLKVLKTLHLVECQLGDIKMIGELGSLLVLSLSGSIITEGLPDEIGKLYKLRLLDLSSCQCKDPRIPANVIARLSLLEGLYLGDSNFKDWAVTESDGGGMDELNKLEFLNVLEIRMVSMYSLPICAEFVKNLKNFQIHLGSQYFKRQPLERSLRISDFNISQLLLDNNNCLKALVKEADLLSLKSVTMKNIVPELDEEGFRELRYLEVASIDSISRICEGKAPKDFFFNLRHLNVFRMDALQDLLPVNPLPHNLNFLKIRNCKSLAYIFRENDGSSPSNKDDDGVNNDSDDDDGVNNDSDIVELPHLKRLFLQDNIYLTSMVKLSGIDDDNQHHEGFFNSKVKLPSLSKLLLYSNARIVKLWGKESNMKSFQNLKELNISECYLMKSLGPLSMFCSLVNLESLEIRNCDEMQHVMSNDSDSESQDIIIINNVTAFPKLKFLQIGDSLKIDCFYNGSCDLQFPRLQTLILSNLPRMSNFQGSENSTTLFPQKMKFPYLEEVELRKLNDGITAKGEGEEIASNPLPKFEKLCLGSSFTATRIRTLEVHECNKLQWLISGEPNQVVELPSLETLEISCCDAMKGFSTRPLKADKLQNIYVRNCPQIESVLLGNTNCGADLELPSLEFVDIEKCPNIKSFSDAVLRAPMLRLLIVNYKRCSKPNCEDLNQFLRSIRGTTIDPESNSDPQNQIQ